MDSAISTRAVDRWRLVLSSVVIAGALGAVRFVRASDHFDGPRASADPPADITDAFAFTSPENSAHLVLAMTVTPFASAASTFSSQVDYVFRLRRVTAFQPLTLDTALFDVTCAFDDAAPQNVTCSAAGGIGLTRAVGDRTGGGDARSPMRIFAGLRSDPAFFDRQGTLATAATGRSSFTGQNAFAGANVLAIVVELDTARAFAAPPDAGSPPAADTGLPTIAVAAETVANTARRGR